LRKAVAGSAGVGGGGGGGVGGRGAFILSTFATSSPYETSQGRVKIIL